MYTGKWTRAGFALRNALIRGNIYLQSWKEVLFISTYEALTLMIAFAVLIVMIMKGR
ncbi:putative holin-like toxin [Paenibacillus sp. FSL K6-4396]|uniref:putative holin-like toxin n=1 Tax=Paenibacillus sp. FSL K6-4396 TaxID=2921506 RepID=UPI0040478009